MSVVQKLLGEAAGETMSAGELIAFLQQFPAETQVYYSHPSHDHWNTKLAGEIKGGEQRRIKHSDYHGASQIDDRDDSPGSVLVLTRRRGGY